MLINQRTLNRRQMLQRTCAGLAPQCEVRGKVIRYSAGMRVDSVGHCRASGRFMLLGLCLLSPVILANQVIPTGGTGILFGGLFNLGCTDLNVGGVLETGTGTYVNVRNVTVVPGGIIQGTGTIRYSGTLSVTGTVQPGVKLIVNLPTNVACPGPPPTIVAVVHPAPALNNFMQASLAALLLLMAFFALRRQAARPRSSAENGANR